jgi:hypothetical protein
LLGNLSGFTDLLHHRVSLELLQYLRNLDALDSGDLVTRYDEERPPVGTDRLILGTRKTGYLDATGFRALAEERKELAVGDVIATLRNPLVGLTKGVLVRSDATGSRLDLHLPSMTIHPPPKQTADCQQAGQPLMAASPERLLGARELSQILGFAPGTRCAIDGFVAVQVKEAASRLKVER